MTIPVLIKTDVITACICPECDKEMKLLKILERWPNGESCLHKCPKCGKAIILEIWCKSNYPLEFRGAKLK